MKRLLPSAAPVAASTVANGTSIPAAEASRAASNH